MSKSRLNELSEQIERKLRASEEAVQAKQEGMNRLMLELERREVEFSKAAARLLEEVVRPANRRDSRRQCPWQSKLTRRAGWGRETTLLRE